MGSRRTVAVTPPSMLSFLPWKAREQSLPHTLQGGGKVGTDHRRGSAVGRRACCADGCQRWPNTCSVSFSRDPQPPRSHPENAGTGGFPPLSHIHTPKTHLQDATLFPACRGITPPDGHGCPSVERGRESIWVTYQGPGSVR